MNHYEVLGVDKGASKETVKRSYRKRAQRAHPDKGGNKEEFHAIQRAYDILGDDARRAHYDQTGEDGGNGPQSHEEQLAQALAQLMFQVIDQIDPEYTDIIAVMLQKVEAQKETNKQGIKQTEAVIARREKVIARMKKKNGENLLGIMLRGDIDQKKRGIEMAKKTLDNCDAMIAALKGYTYDCKARSGYQSGPPQGLESMMAAMSRGGFNFR